MFLQFEADQVKGWLADPRLRRSMEQCIAASNQPETSEDFWARYWYAVWQAQQSQLAKSHLVASLQEACYWAAKDTTVGYSSSHYHLSDFFQMAIERIDRILNGFNPKQSFSLKRYARTAFGNIIKDFLRLRQEIDVCTDWSLLTKTSQRRLTKSLQNAALPAETIDRYLLAWTCFQACYAPTQSPTQTSTRSLSQPTAAVWQVIANLYNSERHTQLATPGTAVTSALLEKWLQACAKAVRSYLYPTVISINTPKPGQEDGELLDDLPDPKSALLTEAIAQEERDRSHPAQVNQTLKQALEALEPTLQHLLQLYYANGLTQQQIAQQLEVKQYTVSRRLTKAKEQLLRALAAWSREVLHISPTSDVLDYSSTILEEWLKAYYRPA